MHVERLKAGDCGELVSFLNRVFSEHNGCPMDFAKKFPRIFVETEEAMGWYWAVKEDGKIVGTAANHPMTYRVGKTLLKVSAGGNVAVDPACRNKGIMQALMHRINGELAEQGFDLAYLHGDRKRYRTFGFERCGLQYNFSFTRVFLEQSGYTGGCSISDLRQEPAGVLDQVAGIMERQRSGFARKAGDVLPALCAQNRLPLVIRNENRQVIGYASMDAENRYIDELGLETAEDLGNVLVSAMAYAKADTFTLCFPEYEWEMVARSVVMGVRYQIVQPANFQILHFDKVIKAFMQAKCSYAPMLNGTLTVDTELFGKWTICCEAGVVSVMPGERAADIVLKGYDVYGFLFGPIHPALAGIGGVQLPPEKAALVTNWFPLPLYCPNLS